MNQVGSIFYEDMKDMLRENNNKFVMKRPYAHTRFSFIQQLRITRIRIVANYERLFRQFLYDTISHITTDYDFSFGALDTRRRNPVDTVGYLICRYNEDNFKCLKALDGAEFLHKHIACKPNMFTDNVANYTFIVNSQEQRDMVIAFNDAYYNDGDINRVLPLEQLQPRRTLAEHIRFERSENERIASERRRLEGDVGRTGRSLQDRLSFNNPPEASAIIKLESDTEEDSDGFSLINNVPNRVSTKRKSARMDDEPPSKIQASGTQCSSNVANDTVDQVVISKEIFDIISGVFTNIIDNVIEQVSINQEKREAEQVKLNDASRLRRMVQYGTKSYLNNTALNVQVVQKSSEKATQTQDLIHKSKSF
jgi:hypothetical protein